MDTGFCIVMKNYYNTALDWHSPITIQDENYSYYNTTVGLLVSDMVYRE